ncbi:restriction endonuclease subunit S [Amylibacter sp.]|nr:restriction endonuclease subunit S [Amylibacter sp.]
MSERVPEGWEIKRLGDYVKLQGGNAFQSSDFRDSGIPIVRISNIRNNKVDLSDAVYYEKSTVYKNFLVANGDILLAMSGATTGKIGRYLLPFQSYLNQRVGRFQKLENKSVCMEFIYQLVRSRIFSENTLIDAVGGAQPNISSSQVEGVFYKIPPLPEQKKIASILTYVDEVIETTQKQIDKLQDLKKATMNELLTKGIGHTEFKDIELGRIPKTWEVVEISNIKDKIDQYSFTGGPFGSNLKSEDYTQKGVRIIQLQNIGDGRFLNNYKIYTSQEKADELKSCNIFPGDIILSKMGDPVARATMIPDFETRFLMASDGIRLSINKNEYDTKFILESINHFTFRKQAELKSTGSTRKRIGLVELRTLKIAIPPLSEQKKIASILTSKDITIEKRRCKLTQTQALKKSLMQDLLTGKVRVQVH